jgi:putative RecB family exonuclease
VSAYEASVDLVITVDGARVLGFKGWDLARTIAAHHVDPDDAADTYRGLHAADAAPRPANAAPPHVDDAARQLLADAAGTAPKTFLNEHLSVSRLKLFEQCGRAFKRKYVDGMKGRYGEAALFGVMLHAVLERLFTWVMETKFAGRLPEARAIELYREEWARCEMTGVALYQEGLDVLRLYLRTFGEVDHRQILAVEQEFKITLLGFEALGYIDRVDRVDDETIRIVDYKSNRMLFSQGELDNDLQMSIYGLAARVLWPWVRRIEFAFHMLRHGLAQTTTRTVDKIDDHASYVAWLGNRTEDPKEKFEPKLNQFCAYCDFRRDCPEYAKALAGDYDYAKVEGREGLDELAALHHKTNNVARLAYRRKEELTELIKARLRVGDLDTLIAGDVEFSLTNTSSTVYPAVPIVEAFESLGVPRGDLLRLVQVSKTDVDELLERVTDDPKYDRGKRWLLRARIESLGDRVAASPRLDSRPHKSREKKAKTTRRRK